ncbi:hypothetical protein OE88DRAFT_1642194 [Heliocybe sulcata]|uniref:RNI-like protein n=1 Tax=Heliocybe sulcata TaxID=5364 RepID=A0A5C3ND12_9AGAM|nr:hypothetical protein OE88DRAFT_1642194 [Heliocybe sulcata]
MSIPIQLYDPKAEYTTDEAGYPVKKYVMPPAYAPGPYESQAHPKLSYVPSLAYFCIKALLEVVDQVHLIGLARLRYAAPDAEGAYDILHALVPSYGSEDFDLGLVDPRLWAVIVQVFNDLPDAFRSYRVPLSDKHVPILQSIPSTPDFTLLTLLDLSGCRHLTDNTITELKALHSLVGLDLSGTTVSEHGIRSLQRTLLWTLDEATGQRHRRGPWPLRILRLNRCRRLGRDLIKSLDRFPLLSFIDLRGSSYRPDAHRMGTFKPCSDPRFCSDLLSENVRTLAEYFDDAHDSDEKQTIFSSRNICTLDIQDLDYKEGARGSQGKRVRWPHRPEPVPRQFCSDRVTTFTKSSTTPGSVHPHGQVDQGNRASGSFRLRGGAPDFLNFSRSLEGSDEELDEEFLAFEYQREHHGYEYSSDEDEDGFPQYGDSDAEYVSGNDSQSGTDDGRDNSPFIASHWPGLFEPAEVLYDRVAALEGQAESSRRAAARFYDASRSRIPYPSPRRHHPSALRDADESQYMLFRPPPPWSVLDEIQPNGGSHVPGQPSSAMQSSVPQRSLIGESTFSSRDVKKAKSVADMISRRKMKHIEGFGEATVATRTSSQTKNPFRKVAKFGEGMAQEQAQRAAADGHVTTSNLRHISMASTSKLPRFGVDPAGQDKTSTNRTSLPVPKVPIRIPMSAPRFGDGHGRTTTKRGDQETPTFTMTRKLTALGPVSAFEPESSKVFKGSTSRTPILIREAEPTREKARPPPAPVPHPPLKPVTAHQVPTLPHLPEPARTSEKKAGISRQRKSLGAGEPPVKRLKPGGQKQKQFDWAAWGANPKSRKSI